MEQIKNLFEQMLKSREDKYRSLTEKCLQEENLIKLISGNTTLTNQRSNNLSKKVNDLKESLQITQNDIEDRITD